MGGISGGAGHQEHRSAGYADPRPGLGLCAGLPDRGGSRDRRHGGRHQPWSPHAPARPGGLGTVGAAFAAESVPAARDALVTAYPLWPLSGGERWLLTARGFPRRGNGGLGRLLAATPTVLLVVLVAKLAWLWAGYRQTLPRAFGGGPEHWAAARGDGPAAWLVKFLVAASAVVLLVRAQRAGLRLSEQAVTTLALVAGAALVPPSLLRLILGVADTVIGGLQPVRGAELAPLVAALILGGWLARVSRSRAAIIMAALVGSCAMVATSALLLGPVPAVQRSLWDLSPSLEDPRWSLVAGLGLVTVPVVMLIAGLRFGLAELVATARRPAEPPDPLVAQEALTNAMGIGCFFLAAALWASMVGHGLAGQGLARQPFLAVWHLVTGATPDPVTVDSALTVMAVTVVAVQVLPRTTVPVALTGVVIGSTLLVHAPPFGLRALQDTPRLLLLGPALAFAFLLQFGGESLNRAGPSRQWRVLTITAALAVLLALVGLGVAERRIQAPASLIPDDLSPSFSADAGGGDVLRLFLGVPLLVMLIAARTSRPTACSPPVAARPQRQAGGARAGDGRGPARRADRMEPGT